MKTFSISPSLSFLFLLFLPKFLSAQHLNLMWQYLPYTASPGSINILCKDLDTDGKQELIFNSNNRIFLASYDGQRLKTQWASRIYDAVEVSVLLSANVDGDTDEDIYFVLSDGTVEVYDGSSKSLIRTFHVDIVSPRAGAIGDVDADGQPELVLTSNESTVIYDLYSDQMDWSSTLYNGGQDLKIGDVDGDGSMEIVLATAPGWGGAEVGYVLNGITRAEEWKYLSGFDSDIELVDTNQDGVPEIISRSYSYISAFDGKLHSPLWQIAHSNASRMCSADLEGDGIPEILLSDSQNSGSIYCYNAVTQEKRWTLKTSAYYQTNLAVGDPDGDGTAEIIWGSSGGYNGGDQVYIANSATPAVEFQSQMLSGPFALQSVVDTDGTTKLLLTSKNQNSGSIRAYDLQSPDTADWNWPLPSLFANLAPSIFQKTRLRSADQYEILIAADSRIWVFDGLTHAALATLDQKTNNNFYSNVTCLKTADLERDGSAIELITANESGYITVYGFVNGTLQKKWASIDLGSPIRTLDVANIDDDPALEIVFSHEDGILQAYDGKTKLLEWQAGPYWSTTGLAVGNIDGEGGQEIVLARDKSLLVIDAKTRQTKGEYLVATSSITQIAVANFDSTQAAEIIILEKGVRIIEGTQFSTIFASEDLVSTYYYGNTTLSVSHDFGELRPAVLVGTPTGAYCFRLSAPLPDLVAPRVVRHAPAANAQYQPTDTPISITFSENLSEASLNDLNVQVTDKKGNLLPRTITFDNATQALYCHPIGTWPPADTLAVLLSGSLTDTAYNSLDGNGNGLAEGEPSDNYRWTFSTGTASDTEGPKALSASATPNDLWADFPIALSVLFSDLSPTASSYVAAAEYFLDQPGADGQGKAMSPLDTWGDLYETARATLATEGWPSGPRPIFAHAQDRFGNWGPCTEITVQVKTDSPGNWPMYGQNPFHTNSDAHSALAPPLKIKWKKTFGDEIALSEVTYAEGNVLMPVRQFIPDTGYRSVLYSLDTLNGGVKWSHNYGDVFSVSPAACAYGLAFVQTSNNWNGTFLTSFHLHDGSVAWQSPFSSQWGTYLGPTVASGKLYLNGGTYGGMYRFDALTGKQDWFAPLAQYDNWTPAVFDGIAYAFTGEFLTAHDAQSGEKLWEKQVPYTWNGYDVGTAPVIDTANRIVFVTSTNHLHAVSLDTKTILWSAGGNLGITPALHQGQLYVVRNGALEARNPKTGAQIWKLAGNNQLAYPPVVAGQHIFVSSENRVLAVAVADGKKVWEYAAGGSLSLGGNLLFVFNTASKTLLAFERSPSGVSQADAEQWKLQVSPNPCTDYARIAYSLPSTMQVLLQVFDGQGKCVATLANETQSAGDHFVDWPTAGLPSGIYNYRFVAHNQQVSGQVVVVSKP